ncbi:L10-interacting MYB domain-containing protein-like isoform X2 [Malania oleifera]|uniref:L10-interacting MYB domain-containing protein-like isoform X2 n=1 Tax=Malania oleifera TaxID=397392 RepID=UPI0025ADCED5|nr:L10-interacting MYB domain-containing protein-like isoform X2 [Malania oleifera]
MEIEASHQPKQERLRTRWTASLDKIFADLVVEQIQLGNRPNNVFDKKTWNHIRDKFNKQTDLNFNNNQLRKHLDVLRTRYYNLKSAFDQNEYAMDDSCCIGFDLWEDIGTQSRTETVKVKDCPIYDQLCTIFTEAGVDGRYAQSSHYEEIVSKPVGIDTAGLTPCPESETPRSNTPSCSRFVQGKASSAEKVNKNLAGRRKKRLSEANSFPGRGGRDEGINDAIAEAMLEMVAASKCRTAEAAQIDERYSITNCIRALDEIEGIDQGIYFTALDLFEEPDLREMFISLRNGEIRLKWLQEKCCSNSISAQVSV